MKSTNNTLLSLVNRIKEILNMQTQHSPTPATAPNRQNQKPVIPDDIRLLINKAAGQLAFIERSYNLSLWNSREKRDNWEHDLALMLLHGDLKQVCLQLIDKDAVVRAKFRYDFSGSSEDDVARDKERIGTEVPLLPPEVISKITDTQVFVTGLGKQESYGHWLRLNWGKAKQYTDRTRNRDQVESKHAGRITGNRMKGTFNLPKGARYNLTITHTDRPDYAFAECTSPVALDNIFVHRNDAAEPISFRIGQQVTADIVQTLKGLQARNIRAA